MKSAAITPAVGVCGFGRLVRLRLELLREPIRTVRLRLLGLLRDFRRDNVALRVPVLFRVLFRAPAALRAPARALLLRDPPLDLREVRPDLREPPRTPREVSAVSERSFFTLRSRLPLPRDGIRLLPRAPARSRGLTSKYVARPPLATERRPSAVARRSDNAAEQRG